MEQAQLRRLLLEELQQTRTLLAVLQTQTEQTLAVNASYRHELVRLTELEAHAGGRITNDELNYVRGVRAEVETACKDTQALYLELVIKHAHVQQSLRKQYNDLGLEL